MNQVRRLRQKFHEVVELVKQGGYPLPYDFSYIDNEERVGMSKELFSFRLWDKPSFALHHSENFGAATIKNAQKRKAAYSEENNEYFVEFLKAEILNDNGKPIEETEGFWFLPILEHHLIGIWNQSLTDEEINKKLKIFEMYGYSEPNSIGLPSPFMTQKGIMAQGAFISNSQQYADGVLMNVKTLYITALFGAIALDIFTVSGARLGEVAQIHFGTGCLNQGDFTDPKTGKTKTSYMFRAIPKGRDEPAIFYVTKDTFDLIEEILIYLMEEHYNGSIPTIKFNYNKETSAPRADQPYMFQFYNKHFDKNVFATVLNFICFGFIYETKENKLVKLKPHLFRHGFATHAVQAEELPIDVVATILNQKDVEVTGYYSQPTQSQVAEVVSDLHTSMYLQIDIMKEVLRQPEELQNLFERQREISGPFSKTVGGTCVTNKVCPTALGCIGCGTKIPEPEQKHELITYLKWAEKTKEIALIEEYRRDKENEPKLVVRKD